jgi:hypothetical protein
MVFAGYAMREERRRLFVAYPNRHVVESSSSDDAILTFVSLLIANRS